MDWPRIEYALELAGKACRAQRRYSENAPTDMLITHLKAQQRKKKLKAVIKELERDRKARSEKGKKKTWSRRHNSIES